MDRVRIDRVFQPWERTPTGEFVLAADWRDVFQMWCGHILCCPGCDPFSDAHANRGEYWYELFALIDSAAGLTWFIPTRFPERIVKMVPPVHQYLPLVNRTRHECFRDNVWYGTIAGDWELKGAVATGVEWTQNPFTNTQGV